MKNNNHKTKQHRGSSPPFQNSQQGLHQWDIGHNSMNQYSDESPYIQFFDREDNQEKERDEQESDFRQSKGVRSGQDSFGDTGLRRNQDDENSWQDDEGEGG